VENLTDEEYKYFFEQIKKFKAEQAKQKQRGLNDYNILTAVREPHAEVGMHSNFIYSLINPDGLHYQGDLFVNLFIKHVLKIDDFGKVKAVEMEEDANGRRIDFMIKSDSYSIGIEMKIYAGDQYRQIKDYYDNLKEKSDQNKKVIMYYLTLDGKDASDDSSQGIEYKRVSFKNEILDWLQKCQYEIKNITNLNEAIKQYIDVVKMVTGQYRYRVKQIYQYFLEDEDLFKKAQNFYHENEKKFTVLDDFKKEIYKSYELARIEIVDNFFLKKLPEYLKQELSSEYKIKSEFNTKEYKYKITLIKNNKKCIIGSKAYGANNDFIKIGEREIENQYRYRYDRNSINHFYLADGKKAKEYYLGIINDSDV
jgi:hypothetical protein